jgi:hypothetical protein
MDNSTKVIENGVVYIPPSRIAHPLKMNSPSPLRVKTRTIACILGSNGDSRSSRKLYEIPSSIPCRVVKVFSKNSCALILFV